MKISGIQKLSLVDYDGHIGATIFVSGCNFACPFCHNAGLVAGTESQIDSNDILEYLQKRFGLLEAVIISGGEPTLYPDLPKFIEQIKKMGYLVKLDSNGTNPEMIKYLYENHLIDYIAMDIKNSFEKYPTITNKNCDIKKIKQSIKYIMSCGIDYEFRTTLVAEFFDENDIKKIGKNIAHAKRYYLQKFEDSGNCISQGLHAISKAQALEFQKTLVKTIPNTKLRGY